MRTHRSAPEALQAVESGQRVFVHGAAATPNALLSGLVSRASRLRNVELLHLHTMGEPEYAKRSYADSFRVVNLFVGPNMRPFLHPGSVDYLPCFLSEIPALFRRGVRRPDVALVHLSAPDRHGFCSLGTSVDVARAAVDTARIVIAQINPRMPRVHGDSLIHVDRIDHAIEIDEPIPEALARPPSPEERAIGRLTSQLVEDGSTLQAGIGAVPDAVLEELHGHRHLGVHSEMWTDGMLRLFRSGAIDNSRKAVLPGRIVSGFVLGSKDLYDFIDDNPIVAQLDTAFVNDAEVISRNPKVVAINSAVEIDLTGQVCADSVGCRIISGVGGQMDFMRGASRSEGGKPIIALTSRTPSGRTRIVPELQPGAGVVTTRAHAHFVITEHGVADLYGKTLDERARLLIGIAHPGDREMLERAWRERCG